MSRPDAVPFLTIADHNDADRLPQWLPRCSVAGCERRAVSRGWCRRDYLRWQRHGDPTWTRPSVAMRLARRSARVGDCLVWTGAIRGDGYGSIRVNGKAKPASRAAYEEAHGPVPKGMVVMRTCDNPPCINLDHLILGTQQANVRDALAKGRRPQNRVRQEAA